MDKTKEAFAEYKDVVTVCEVMEMLGLGRVAVYRLLREGIIRTIRVGKSISFPSRALSTLSQQENHFLERVNYFGRKLNNKRQLLLCQISYQRQTENDCHEDTR